MAFWVIVGTGQLLLVLLNFHGTYYMSQIAHTIIINMYNLNSNGCT